MRNIVASVFAAALLALVSQSSYAMNTMHHSMMMPTCAAGDPVVGVNTMTHMYMSHSQMKAKMAGMSPTQMHTMMMTHHVTLMCKSKADAAGDKMMKSM